jgi:hypothetical protein
MSDADQSEKEEAAKIDGLAYAAEIRRFFYWNSHLFGAPLVEGGSFVGVNAEVDEKLQKALTEAAIAGAQRLKRIYQDDLPSLPTGHQRSSKP